MSDPRDDLAAEIRKRLATETPGDPPGYWWYDDGRDGDLPEALAADLIAAGWRPPVPHCDHDWSADRSTYGGNPWRECNLCGKQEDL